MAVVGSLGWIGLGWMGDAGGLVSPEGGLLGAAVPFPTLAHWSDPLVMVTGLLGVVTVALLAAAWLRRHERKAPASGEPPAADFLRSIADTANLFFARYRQDGSLAWMSPSVARILGIEAREFLERRVELRDLVHQEDRETFASGEAMRTTGTSNAIEFQYRVRAADGSWRWLHERQRRLPAGKDGGGWETVAVDFTDRRQADERERRQLEVQRLSTRVLESFLRADDFDAAVASLLPLLGQAFGLSRGTFLLVEQRGLGIRPGHEWLAPGVESAVARRQTVEPANLAWWKEAARAGLPIVITRDELFDPQSPAAAIHPEVQSLLAVPILVGGKPRGGLVFEDLLRPRKWHAEEIGVFQTLAFAIARGIEQQEATDERRRFEELQRQLERSELVAHLAGGVAHDFNNILFAIGGHVQLLRLKALEPDVAAALLEIERVIADASDIVAGLLQAHRGDVERPRPVELAKEIGEAMRLATRVLPRSLALETRIEPLAGVLVRSTQQGLRQLVLNLVINSRDATNGRGRVRIEARSAHHAVLGPCVLLTVEDNGPGIPPELREKVLQPFFTTKGSGGTGLGFVICQRVAGEAGGAFELAQSSELGGLRVEVWLPIVEASEVDPVRPTSIEPANDVSLDAEGGERLADVASVLVIEDDDAVRDVLVATFQSLDIDVVARCDARELEALVIDGPLPYDLLVMDIDLPGRTGIEALAAVRSRGVRLPCLFVTGGTGEPPASLAPMHTLRKPFRIDTLIAAARRLLDESRAVPGA